MTKNALVHSAAEDHVSDVVCAVLMPHAPILVPGVGGERGTAAAASRRAMRAAAACVTGHRPETVVLISPHSPRQPQLFGLWDGEALAGSFAPFNAPKTVVGLPLDHLLSRTIAAECHTRNLGVWTIVDGLLDHGALVPLWFLAEAGWSGPAVIVSLTDAGADRLTALGAAIAAAAHQLSRRIAVIASGDMSHRLCPGAPCGFDPRAREFDETFIHRLRAGDGRALTEIPAELRALAAEDAVDSTLIAAAAAAWRTTGHEVLSYEAPFGVGYGVAILFAETSTPQNNVGRTLPELARRSVTVALTGGDETPPPPADDYAAARRGVFVTLRRLDGTLRGCVGTIVPACPNLLAETWRSARQAALQDPRFKPVTAGELAILRFAVSVLHPPEDIASAAELDPGRYGVIVSAGDGRCGLLLPGIKEIQTVAQQLLIARKKGGIDPDEPIHLQRFLVDHFEEQD